MRKQATSTSPQATCRHTMYTNKMPKCIWVCARGHIHVAAARARGQMAAEMTTDSSDLSKLLAWAWLESGDIHLQLCAFSTNMIRVYKDVLSTNSHLTMDKWAAHAQICASFVWRPEAAWQCVFGWLLLYFFRFFPGPSPLTGTLTSPVWSLYKERSFKMASFSQTPNMVMLVFHCVYFSMVSRYR